MPEPKIRRKFRTVPITLTTSESSATAIRTDDIAGATLVCGTQHTSAVSIQVWAAATAGGTYGRLYDYAGSPANITLTPSSSTGSAYSLPDAAFGCAMIKLVAAEAVGTITSATVVLKS